MEKNGNSMSKIYETLEEAEKLLLDDKVEDAKKKIAEAKDLITTKVAADAESY